MLLAHRTPLVAGCILIAPLASCAKEKAPVAERAAPNAAPSAATAGQKRVELVNGTASFMIDAPLEKIKGRSTKMRGNIDIDPQNLKASRGQIEVDLDDLRTETFDDDTKNKTQTEHTKNWLEIGHDVDPQRREENRWARFTIKSIDSTSIDKLGDTHGTGVTIQATGDLWLHGVITTKTVSTTMTFAGPPERPTRVRIVTIDPLVLSLKNHDVKPRDLAGKFLAGALEKVGQKIDDAVQISLDLTAQ